MTGETIAMIKALRVKSIEELKTSGGSADAGKVLTVGSDGQLLPAELEVGEGQIAVDGSLTVSGAAADAKVVGDAISAVNGSLVTDKVVPLLSTFNGYISNDKLSGVINDDCRTAIYKIYPNAAYNITKKVESAAFKIATCSNTPAVGTLVDGVKVLDPSDTNLEVSYMTGANANYLLVYYFYNDDAEGILESISVVGGRIIDELYDLYGVNGISKTEMVQVDSGALYNRIIGHDNNDDYKWSATKQGYSRLYPLEPCDMVYIKQRTNTSISYAFLRSNVVSTGAQTLSIENPRTHTTMQNTLVKVPTDARYLYIQTETKSGLNLRPEYILYVYKIRKEPSAASIIQQMCNSQAYNSDTDGRDIPLNIGVLNAYKKAHQLADIKWTAKGTIPTNSSSTGIAPNVEKTGMLYSEALQFEKYVPYNCSIKTFMTAINNPHSVMYTEDTKGTDARKKSAYGFDYLNTTLNGAYYGTTCSTFASYALGLTLNSQSKDISGYMVDNLDFVEVKPLTPSAVRLMDIIWEKGHVRLVTDIYRDSRGNLVSVHVTESVQDLVQTNVLTASAFTTLLSTRKLYRYTKLYENIGYSASQFVSVEDETENTPYIYNDDICTYLGDEVSIADWEHMYINYVKGEYTYMELYKDNNLLETINLPSEYNATHSVNVTSFLDGAGDYKARLTNGTDNSNYTYFEVIETTVTKELDTSKREISLNFSSANGVPVGVRFKNLSGSLYATYEFNEQEKSKGTAVIKYTELLYSQYRVYPQETLYARVVFEGRYNQVIGDYVDTEIIQS